MKTDETYLPRVTPRAFRIGANVVHVVAPVRETRSILFGHPDAPYIRLNVNDTKGVDEEAQQTLDALILALKASLVSIVLEPGESVYVDNFRALHGRPPFTPRYDGTDRWLRGIYLTSYLRMSRSLRQNAESRLIEARMPKALENQPRNDRSTREACEETSQRIGSDSIEKPEG